jgi:hypothetical protein
MMARRPVTWRWGVGLFLVLWLALTAIQESFPVLQPGSDRVVARKYDLALHQDLFADDPRRPPCRVVAIGDSKVLAGFEPDLFDRRCGPGCRSWNMGLPGIETFHDLITGLGERSHPTHLLLIYPPSAEATPSLWQRCTDDDAVLDALFPFRPLPRNLFNFLRLSRHAGGPLAYARQTSGLLAQMVADRGYFFIASQSLYPGDRLPDDFSLPSDHPDRPDHRAYDDRAAARALADWGTAHGIAILLIPPPLREHAAAAPDPDPGRVPTDYPLSVVGPDYLRYPSRCFSDFVHLNRSGAERYTEDLARLLHDRLAATAATREPHAVQ